MQSFASLVLMILGIYFIVDGMRTMLNKNQDVEKDSVISKKLLSSHTRYWIGRYYGGIKALGAGLGCIALAIILYLSK